MHIGEPQLILWWRIWPKHEFNRKRYPAVHYGTSGVTKHVRRHHDCHQHDQHHYGHLRRLYGRMVEINLTVSLDPIPLTTMVNHEWGSIGQNYLKSLFVLGFQAFLIMVCVGSYAVLVQRIAIGADIMKAVWTCMGYTVLLCFMLFKTGSLSKSVF